MCSLHERHICCMSKYPDYSKIIHGDIMNFDSDSMLLVIDMQNDFIPDQKDHHASFGVSEGLEIVSPICKAIDDALASKCTVVITRDYHPSDHCSFKDQGGPFPPHCVWNSKGSDLHNDIVTCLDTNLKQGNDTIHVVFKGFHNEIDSFGAVTYTANTDQAKGICGYDKLHLLSWTGSFKSSTIDTCSAIKTYPPDMKSEINNCRGPDGGYSCTSECTLTKLDYIIHENKPKNIYICGLAGDYCVKDTALNIKAKFGADYSPKVYVISDCTRYVHIPKKGSLALVPLNDPCTEIIEKYQKADVKLIDSSHLLKK
jgi:nicotinamidase-related amidase